MREKVMAILRVSIVVLFMSYYFGATLFPHTHNFEWGKVTHSHPYFPSAKHTHSVAGCNLIASLTSLLFLASTVALLFVAKIIEFTFKIIVHKHVISLKLRHCPLRAPPIY